MLSFNLHFHSQLSHLHLFPPSFFFLFFLSFLFLIAEYVRDIDDYDNDENEEGVASPPHPFVDPQHLMQERFWNGGVTALRSAQAALLKKNSEGQQQGQSSESCEREGEGAVVATSTTAVRSVASRVVSSDSHIAKLGKNEGRKGKECSISNLLLAAAAAIYLDDDIRFSLSFSKQFC
jgi:hypothetical protein